MVRSTCAQPLTTPDQIRTAAHHDLPDPLFTDAAGTTWVCTMCAERLPVGISSAAAIPAAL